MGHPKFTSISANTDGPHDAALCKIDHIALPTKYNELPGNECQSIANTHRQMDGQTHDDIIYCA